MAENMKKFLDQQGVTVLWGKIAAKVKADIEAESALRVAAEQKIAGDLSALDTRVGVLPETTTATNVVEYINKKTADIASGEAMTQLAARVAVNEGDIATIKGDYLTSVDEAALTKAINDEAARADAAEKANAAAIKAVSDDYLKAADKTELANATTAVSDRVGVIEGDYLKAEHKTALENAIALKADATALAQEVTDRENAVSGLQTQIDTIMSNPDAEGAINSINEFTQYVKDHGEIAEGFRTSIANNAKAIEDEAAAARAAEGALSGRLDTLEAIDHEAYIAADTALENKLNAEIAKKADAEAMTTALAGKASTDELKAVSDVANAAATKTYVDEELAKKATVEALNGVSAVANAAAVKTEVEAALALKADASALEAEVTARQNAVKANSDAIAAIKDHATVDSFADVVAELAKKQDTIPANTYDLHGAAAQALIDANAHTDAEFAKITALSEVEIQAAIDAASNPAV